MESEDGKLFVGGLLRETSEETLKQHFSKYGQVKQCQVMKDFTGRSRGFGFVTFVDPSHVHQALTDSKHPMIDGRAVEVKPAKPREVRPYNHNGSLLGGYGNKNYTRNDHHQQDFKTKKIFVGGLAVGLNNDDFKKYFEDYGTVTDAVVMHDRKTREPRGFGFITFDSEDSVDNVLQRQKARFHEIGNKRVEVKKATPKETRMNFFNSYKTGFEMGFGNSGYGNYYPWSCYYDAEGNPYSEGLHYYYAPSPFPLPYPNYNYAAPPFYGSNSWNRADHANYSTDRDNYSTPRVVHKNDDGAENSGVSNNVESKERAESSGVSNNVGSEERAVDNNGVPNNVGSEQRAVDNSGVPNNVGSEERAVDNDGGSEKRAENGGVDNNIGTEERAENSGNGVDKNGGSEEVDKNGRSEEVDKNGRSEERADYVEFSTPRAIQDNVGIDEQIDYAAFYTPRAVHNVGNEDQTPRAVHIVGNEDQNENENENENEDQTPRVVHSVGNEDQNEDPADHADSGPRESGGGVCSRSNGNDAEITSSANISDCKEAEALIAETTSSVHMSDCKEAEALIVEINGSDNPSGATGQDQSSPSS